jgi:hypothetical protein
VNLLATKVGRGRSVASGGHVGCCLYASKADDLNARLMLRGNITTPSAEEWDGRGLALDRKGVTVLRTPKTVVTRVCEALKTMGRSVQSRLILYTVLDDGAAASQVFELNPHSTEPLLELVVALHGNGSCWMSIHRPRRIKERKVE